jgi:hypothetical protein
MLLAGCGPASQPPTGTALSQPAPVDPIAEAERLLAQDVVDQHKFSRDTLYTWTTSEQIRELQTGSDLLTRDESPTSGSSYVDQVLHALAGKGDPLAVPLYTTPFAKMRFAWPSLWPTRGGWPDEQYGDQLVRITLKPQAWVAYLSTATGTFEIHDLRDGVVPLDRAVTSPERIAAIYFVSDAGVPTASGIPRALASFREYVLCNESMIASWEVGTARIADEVDRAARLVDTITHWVETAKPVPSTPVPEAWREAKPGAVGSYHGALALDSAMYQLHPVTLRTLAAQLRATPRPPAVERVPHAVFAPGTVRKPPRIVRRGDVTFARPATATSAHP